MINDFIKQIVDLDNETEAEMNRIHEEVTNLEETSNLKIKSQETQIVDKVTNSCKEVYTQKLEEAEIKKDQIVREAKKKIKEIEKDYEEVKIEAANNIIQFLLENSDG